MTKTKFWSVQKENLLLGSFYVLLAGISYGFLGTLVKLLGPHLPDSEIIFFRFITSLVLMIPYFIIKKRGIRTEYIGNHLVRAFFSLSAVFLLYYSLQRMPLADAMLLNNTLPLFIPFIAWIWQNEKIPLRLIPALLIGFIGILFILRPTKEIFNVAAIAALCSGLFAAIAMVGIRELALKEPIDRILLYYFALSSVVTAFPLFWQWKTPSPLELIALIATGIFGFGYQILLTMGYKAASASKVSPFIYFTVIVSGLFDWLIWHVIPDLFSFLGLLLVIIGSSFAIREKKAS